MSLSSGLLFTDQFQVKEINKKFDKGAQKLGRTWVCIWSAHCMCVLTRSDALGVPTHGGGL